MVSPLSPIQFGQPEKTDLAGSYLSGRQAYQKTQMNDQALKQGEQQIGRADYDQAVQRLSVIHQLATKARSIASPQDREAFINSVNPEMLRSVGVDPAQVAQAPRDDNGLDALIAQTGASMPSKLVGEAASFEQMTQGLSKEDKEQARRKALYLDAKPSNAQEIILAQDPSLADKVRDNKVSTAGAVTRITETTKADVEGKTRPDIQSSITTATNDADAVSKAKVTAQKNANAMAVYESGIASVKTALENTTTGPISGKLPALTAEQQTAEGSIAAMAPVLKSLFREAGEGTFTKEDQQVLMDMLPTRKDLAVARDAKLKNVDALVKLKLASPSQSKSSDRIRQLRQDLGL